MAPSPQLDEALIEDAAVVRAAFEAQLRRREAETKAHVRQLRAHLPAIAELVGRAGAANIWLIGSLAWGSPHPDSDIDIATEGLSAGSAAALRDDLREIANAPVDVVRIEDLPEWLQDRTRNDGVPLS